MKAMKNTFKIFKHLASSRIAAWTGLVALLLSFSGIVWADTYYIDCREHSAQLTVNWCATQNNGDLTVVTNSPEAGVITISGITLGYKSDGEDSLLDGAKEFLESIPDGDKIVFLTSREEKYREQTESFLNRHDIRYDAILFELPFGERILLNDKKESGLETAIAVNKARNSDGFPEIQVDNLL